MRYIHIHKLDVQCKTNENTTIYLVQISATFFDRTGLLQAGHKNEKTSTCILFIVVSLMIITFGRKM